MSLRKILLGLVATAAMSGVAGAGTANGWYLSLEAGANWVDDWSSIATRNAPPEAAEATFSTGWAAFGSVGYAFASHWRAELELGYRANELDSTTPGNLLWVDGDLWEATAMANVATRNSPTNPLTSAGDRSRSAAGGGVGGAPQPAVPAQVGGT